VGEAVQPLLRPVRDELAHRLAVAAAEAALFGGTPAEVRVGRFVLRERLGAGGLGVVYAAHDTRLHRDVALKLVRRRPGADRDADARLLDEARAMARLSDPHVVTVYDAGPLEDEDGAIFIAMERVDGEPLRSWSRREARTWPEILDVLVAAGRGLAAAHAVGLVHHDVKPDNVLVRRDGRPQVGDFGLAARSDTATEARSAIGGTPAYMAPEQHAGGATGLAADLFAFSVMSYEALYGRLPFQGESSDALAAAKASESIIAPPRTSLVPPRIFEVLRRGLSADPAERFPSMDALLRALTSDPAHRRRRLLLVAVITLFVGIVLTGAVFQGIVFFAAMNAG
jgi:serine/threonine protein kinase